MKRTARSKMMMVAMACTMLFTGVSAEAAVTREAKAANGACPYCVGYADDIYGPGIYWFEAEETYYNGNAYLSVVKVSDTRFRIYDENGYWVEFSGMATFASTATEASNTATEKPFTPIIRTAALPIITDTKILPTTPDKPQEQGRAKLSPVCFQKGNQNDRTNDP